MRLEVDIECRYADFALTARFRSPGRLTGLFGPSGAGKSTLLKVLAGLAAPARGRIVVGDQTVFDDRCGINLTPDRRPVGLVFQDGRLFPHMDVRRNLEFALRVTPRSRRAVTLDRVVEVLDLKPLLPARIGTLSGGQRQRVALGRTLLTCPKLLLLDEPLSALDARSKQPILAMLHRVQQAFDMDMLVVSHSLGDLLLLTESLLLLDSGRLAGIGTPGDLMRGRCLADLAGRGGIPNVLDLTVQRHDRIGGVTEYVHGAGGSDRALRGSLREDLSPGTPVRALLSPDEVALAWAPVETISMQNQRRGRIREMIPCSNGVYCRVDVGFDLWSRLTTLAVQELALEPGKQVWCLFKSFAFDLMETGRVSHATRTGAHDIRRNRARGHVEVCSDAGLTR
jgi:molybdate transport system ATP-binding protein